MPITLKIAAATALLALATACSGSPAAPTATPVDQTPAATTQAAPSAGTPTLVPAAGSECATFPTFDPLGTDLPSFTADPVIESKFPAQIDGQPVREVESFNWAQIACLGGQGAIDEIRDIVEFDLMTLTMATAVGTVSGEEVSLIAFRSPGGDANEIVSTFAELAAAAGEQSDIESIVPGTAGGKSALVVTDVDGLTSYGYVNGDTLMLAESVSQAQADKIFAALP